jgi:succinate dehydrogenase/fumarate reductase cytochrome b subunit
VVLPTTIAPLASHVPDHAKEFAHVAVKALVVVFNYVLQILQTLFHRLHGLETFVNRRVEIRDGVTASRTTHRMQSEWFVITIVSTVVATVVATTVVAAVGAFGSLLLGHLIPNVKVVIISSGGRP